MIKIDNMTCDDIDLSYEIEEEAFQSERFSKEYFIEIVENKNLYYLSYVIKEDNIIIGFILIRVIDRIADILQICIKKHFQNKNYGDLFLKDIIHKLKNKNVDKIMLEVREENIPAIKLYNKNGFVIISKRNNYYKNPSSNALIMNLDLRG